jgi:hypothetical protein
VDQLTHFGIKGMRWGKRKTPTEMASKYITKQRKLGMKNEKLAKKIVKADIHIAKKKTMTRHYREKFDAQSVRAMTSGLSGWEVRKLKRAAKNLKYASRNETKATWAAARYRKRVFKNEQMVKTLDKKLSELDPKAVKKGRALVEAAFK